MIARPLIPFLLLAGLPAAAHAQDKPVEPWTLQEALGEPDNLKISGSLRARYESLSNQFRPGLDENDDIVLFRASLFAEYDTGPIRIGGELIDARAYVADEGGPVGTGEVNAFELVQAYIGGDLGAALGEGSNTSVELGRFTLDLGSRRLVGRNNFRNTTNAFTGVRAQLVGADKTSLTAFYTLPHTRLPSDKAAVLDNAVEWDRESFDLSFWGAFLSKPGVIGDGTLELYYFGLNEDDSPGTATRDRLLHTPGARLYRTPKPGQWDYEIEAAYQFGNIRASIAADAVELDVSAHTVHAELGYQFDAPWSPRIAFEYDLASGDRSGGDYTRFDSLYGVRRPDWGPSSIYGPFGRNNISSPGIRFEVTPDKRWDGFAFYRAVWLDSATDSLASTGVRDPAGQSGHFGGHQVEARARYWIVPRLLRLDAGGALLFNGPFLEDAPNANGFGDPVYGYIDLTATF